MAREVSADPDRQPGPPAGAPITILDAPPGTHGTIAVFSIVVLTAVAHPRSRKEA